VTTVTATDADPGTTLTYSIIGGMDAGLFTIDPTTGVLTFVSAPDHENPADLGADNVYSLAVLVTDGMFIDIQVLAVTVTNSNDNGPNITSDGGGSSASLSVAENTTAVTTVTATDADPGTTLTYALVGGVDAALFAIDGSTGVLTFVSAPDYENPADLGADNVYSLTVLVTDGTFIDVQSIDVTVTDGNDYAPVVSTTGGSAAYTVGDPGVVIDGGLTVTDADVGDLMAGATVDPGAGNFAPGDVLSFDSVLAAGYGISGSYDGVTTGVLTFTGNATAAEYQAVLRTVVFATSVNASFTATFTFTVNDGDVTGSGSRNVAVTNV
jgi:hypothetical protein